MNRPLAASEARPLLRTSGWTLAAAAFAVAVVVLLASYWQTVESLVWAWDHDGTYQYAFLIFPLSLWVAFTLRGQLRSNPPIPSAWGLLAVAALVLVWYAGRLLDINLAQHFAFVALFPALVLACWGWRAVWVLAFPLGYLVVFAIPWGDGLVGPLQDITAHFAVRALELTGTPVLLNGREIITPSATWMVEDACSGVRFFAACTALGSLYAYLMYHRWWKRVIFVALSAVVPVIANGLRVYFTVLIGETWGLHYATGTDHLVFGWQFFGTVLVLLLLTGWFFRDRPVERAVPEPSGKRPANARSIIWPAAIVLFVAAPVAAAMLVSPVPPRHLDSSAPAIAGWHGPQAASNVWRPSFHGAAGEVLASYRSAVGGGAVELFHAIYTGRPRRGHSLITYGNDLYDPQRARVLSHTNLRVDLAAGQSTSASELRLISSAGSRLVWYWYCINSRCTRSPIIAQLLQAWGVLRGDVTRSSVWALSSEVSHTDVNQARARMRSFARSLPVAVSPDARSQRAPDGGGDVP
jgi:exosortase A